MEEDAWVENEFVEEVVENIAATEVVGVGVAKERYCCFVR